MYVCMFVCVCVCKYITPLPIDGLPHPQPTKVTSFTKNASEQTDYEKGLIVTSIYFFWMSQTYISKHSFLVIIT